MIPVYNGAPYVRNAISTALSQLGSDIEIIVSVDLSDDDSELIARSFNDPRLKVFGQSKRLGMTENYRFLISKAHGEWITIFGQDDAILPYATCLLRAIASQFIDHDVITSRRSFMFWPDTNRALSKYSFIYPIDTRKPRIVSSSRSLLRSISGLSEYSEGPQLYTGSFVKLSLIERITEVNQGNFYNYLIPDISSAVNILTNSSEYVYLPLPLFLIGSSSRSTGIAIDRSISESTDSIPSGSLKDFFSNSTDGIITPGNGVFTSSSWYMYEAFTQSSESKSIRGLTDIRVPLEWLALSALRYESSKTGLFSTVQEVRYSRMREQAGMPKCFLAFRLSVLYVVVFMRKVSRRLHAVILLFSRRLILSTEYDQDLFSTESLCEQVTQNRSLRRFLDETTKAN